VRADLDDSGVSLEMTIKRNSTFAKVCPILVAFFFLVYFAAASYASNCSRTSVGFIPLNDLGSGTYQNKKGGLYPHSENIRPSKHEKAGLALAQKIGPLSPTGKSDANGKYVLLSIGMSNTGAEFGQFIKLAKVDPLKDPRLVIVNGGIPRQPANLMLDPNDDYWPKVQLQLQRSFVTPKQVTVVWIKQADAGPKLPFPSDAKKLRKELRIILGLIHQKFPKVKLAYMSSRIYAGYATTTLNPEPFAYQSGFAVKWLIGSQIVGSARLNYDPKKGRVKSPWLSWGPYLWADGLHPRSDGLTWSCSDFRDDGTHPSDSGTAKVASLLLQYFQTDVTAREWYLANP
jgi:hypothetical protein